CLARRAGRLLRVGAVDGGARAGVRHVAGGSVGRAADRAGVPGRVLAGVVRAIALVEGARVAVRRAAGARRLLQVGGGAGCGGARAGLGYVALIRCAAADRRRRLEQIIGTGGTRARAGLGDIAEVGSGAANRAGVAGRVLAGVVSAVALIEGAYVIVRLARRAGRLLRVGAVDGGARASIRHVAGGSVGRAADRAGVPGRVLAGVVRAIALV